MHNKPFPPFSNSHTHRHTHAPREPPDGLCVTSATPPVLLSALLITQVTTVKVLAMGQQRHSLASGTLEPVAPTLSLHLYYYPWPTWKAGISCYSLKRSRMSSDWESISPKQTCHAGLGTCQTNGRGVDCENRLSGPIYSTDNGVNNTD